MLSSEFREISKNTIFTEHLWAAASDCNLPRTYFGNLQCFLLMVLSAFRILKSKYLFNVIKVKVFKNGPSKTYGRQPLKNLK